MQEMSQYLFIFSYYKLSSNQNECWMRVIQYFLFIILFILELGPTYGNDKDWTDICLCEVLKKTRLCVFNSPPLQSLSFHPKCVSEKRKKQKKKKKIMDVWSLTKTQELWVWTFLANRKRGNYLTNVPILFILNQKKKKKQVQFNNCFT